MQQLGSLRLAQQVRALRPGQFMRQAEHRFRTAITRRDVLACSIGAKRWHGGETHYDESNAITVYFVDREQKKTPVRAPVGANMLRVAHHNGIELEGACEGSLACSTCHVYVDEQSFSKLEEPCDDENDMLDLAFALQENSRLGCQIVAQPELDGMTLTLPSATRNMAVDGYVPKPH